MAKKAKKRSRQGALQVQQSLGKFRGKKGKRNKVWPEEIFAAIDDATDEGYSPLPEKGHKCSETCISWR